ncbi:tuberin [Cryptococcus neoformans Tu259-1]|uniref:Tuberin n=1 Tax=Cryptococcus neoformans Tu259-1 TaxID=1230072 RepID=A0A854QP55_CRYNE|nr:tuberin [Cryptococcus neoformans var. grubii Tu259-1]
MTHKDVPQNAQTVRMMVPFSMRCNRCGEYIHKGKRINANKETIHGEQIDGLDTLRLHINCSVCSAEITFKTDLLNAEYVCEDGATCNSETDVHNDNVGNPSDGEEQEAHGGGLGRYRTGSIRRTRENNGNKERELMAQLADLRERNKRLEISNSTLLAALRTRRTILKPLDFSRTSAELPIDERIHQLLSTNSPLSDTDAHTILEYYQEHDLCMPVVDDWLDNIWKLLNLFYLSSHDLPEARRSLALFLFNAIYVHIEQISDLRNSFVSQVIVPFLEKTLSQQADDWFRQTALDVLVKAAVMETRERDEERRQVRARKKENEVEQEDAAALPSQEMKAAAAGGSFHAIRNIIITQASSARCKREDLILPKVEEKLESTTPPAIKEPPAISSRESFSSSSGFKGFMSALSPPSRTKELPPMSTPSIASSIAEDTQSADHSPTPTPPPSHSTCPSHMAVRSLIAIFNQLAFQFPSSSPSHSKSARTLASSRCIAVYRDLLGLVYPTRHMPGDVTPASRVASVHASCPKARVTILQLLFRLRADFTHRIYLRQNIDDTVRPFADILGRTREAIETQRANILADAEEARARLRARQMREAGGAPRESMRERASTASSRTRSRSRPGHIDSSAADSYNPLWQIPEALSFDMPVESVASEVLLTYDPDHPSLRLKDVPPVEDVWLPVSEYVACLCEILMHEKNWEVVSYVICFLPLQLGSRLFFRGARATREVRRLLKVLCDTIPQDNRIERRCKHHAFIKRPNVNAVVYQALTILISYKDDLDSKECDTLIATFEMCLESNAIVAKPCIQALTLCVFELEQSIAKRLLPIISKMRDINLTSGIAVHLLEFILALGDHQSLFRNFTDAHYKDVFTLVIDYIAEHNARSDELPDMTSDKRESYTLSQHVIGLAYHAIYVWYLALKLSLRPDLVRHIITKLLQSRSIRVATDEMVEVCLDWLARYTYGNPDPKPASSLLNEMVARESGEFDPPKKRSWSLGNAILTVTLHAGSGWASITSTRPTGATELIARLENLPLSEIDDDGLDLFLLPKLLMENRGLIMKDEEQATLQQLFMPMSISPDSAGSSIPSQRRKEVAVDPAYFAIQLLSYPADSLDSIHGRPIPNEERFNRSLRNIELTPVIDTAKLGVLYVAPGQTDEHDILANIEGSSFYREFLGGLGSLIKLKGQVDVFTGGLNREDDSDGEYAYAWWNDLIQTVFHAATMMPNHAHDPKFDKKKRLIGNDFVKIIYNDSGREYKFDTLKTAFNFINIVISPHAVPDTYAPTGFVEMTPPESILGVPTRDDYFKVIVQRAPGIPDFSPVGKLKILSKETLPGFVRHVALMANDMAARFAHIRNASDPAEAEYITSWRSRLRAMNRLKGGLPPVEAKIDSEEEKKREEMLQNFTKLLSEQPIADPDQ